MTDAATLSRGDHVTVEGLDGDESRAVMVGIADARADAYTIPTRNGERTLAEYWRGHDVDGDERVIEIRYVKGVDIDGEPVTYSQQTYGMPESQVSRDE